MVWMMVLFYTTEQHAFEHHNTLCWVGVIAFVENINYTTNLNSSHSTFTVAYETWIPSIGFGLHLEPSEYEVATIFGTKYNIEIEYCTCYVL